MEYDLFKELDMINIVDKEYSCCDLHTNYIHTEEGIIICKVCDNSISNIVSTPEKNYLQDSKKVPRHGMPVNQLLPKSSVGTTIAPQYSCNAMNRIERYQRWNSMPYKERSLYIVFTTIQEKCDKNDLPAVIARTAKSLYTLIAETKISRGNNRKGIIAACVFNACKECNVPRSSNEIAKIFDIDTKIITKGIKKYTEIMRLDKKNIVRTTCIKSITIVDFIDRFSHKLKLNTEHISDIRSIVDQCISLKIDKDNTPPAMASGCIYLYIKLSSLNIGRKEISIVSQISEVTINKCYKKIHDNNNIQLYLQKLTLNYKID